VAHLGRDNNPVYLTPYAGLPFIALATWMLIDGFVKASRELEDMNASLEARVAHGSAELRRALDAMRAAKDDAEQADRAKSRFLAAASHDLRQPTHALGLYLGSIPVDHLAEPMRDTLQRMGQSLTALQAMLEALLDMSRMDAGVVVPELRAFDLNAVLRRLGDEFAPLAERKGLRLALRGAVAGNGQQAYSDPLLIERIVRNLLANAVQYTQQGGVLLSWRLRGASGADPSWLVEVRDTGCGIPVAEQGRVFDEFYRLVDATVQSSQGLGLGLSIVERLSRLLRLELRLRSWPGRGTQLAFTVGATRQQPQPLVQQHIEPMPAGRWVAVVEDDPDVLAAMRALLAEWQCRWIDGKSGDQVLDHWRSTGRPRVDAILADFRLQPGHTGLDAIAQLRAAFDGRSVPALVITGDAAPERLRALSDSALPWLSKPVPAARLRSWLAWALMRDASAVREVAA
jgi:signal transduction histidine kinase/CheY-like chemotaxis protein